MKKEISSISKRILVYLLSASLLFSVFGLSFVKSYAATQYYFDKYNTTTYWNAPTFTLTSQTAVGTDGSYTRSCYSSATWDGTNKQYTFGSQTTLHAGFVWSCYDPGSSGGALMYRLTTSAITNPSTYILETYTASTNNLTASYSAGTLVQANVVGTPNQYPTNGKASDGYYYIRRLPVDDVTPPTINTSLSTTAFTKSDVTINVTTTDDDAVSQVKWASGSQTSDYFTNNGTALSGSTITATSNGTYTIWAVDRVGNQSLKEVVVSNIDKVAPTDPTVTVDGTNVTINGGSDENYNITYYRIGTTGSYTGFTEPSKVISLNPGSYSISVYTNDKAGNSSATKVFNVTTSDTVKPNLNLSLSSSDPTNSDVTVNVSATDNIGVVTLKYASGSQTESYFASNGTTLNGTTFTTSSNGTYTVYAADAAGNATVQTITINNIDKISPTVPSISINGNQLTVAPGIDSSGIKTTEYRLNNGSWTTYSSAVTLPDGVYTIDARSIDNAGNVSLTATITATVTVQAEVDAQKIQDELNAMQDNLENGNFTLPDLDHYKDRLSELVDEVLALPSGSTQDALLQQISDLSDLIDLIESVFAASTGDLKDVDLNQLNNLPDSPLKDQLQQEVNEAQQVADAIEAATALVVKLEGSYAQVDVTPAQNAVNALPASNNKTALQNRINVVTKFLNDLSAATAKVVTAEATKAQADVDEARVLVNALADRPEKTALLNRLNAIQVGGQVVYTNISDIADPAVRSLLKDVDFYVTQAEKYFIRDNITLAKDKVIAIPTNISSDSRYAVICQNLKDRTNYLITLYNQELADAKLQVAINNANTAVANYEKYKTAYYKSRAQAAINALEPGAIRDGLQARFDAVA